MRGDRVEKIPEPDLTTTIHLGADHKPDISHSSNISQPPSPSSSLKLNNFANLTDEERGIVAKLSPEDGMLIVHRGPGKGSRFLLTDASTIGRSPESDIFLDDVTVSRKHAGLAIGVAGESAIKDLGSLNGTYVNGKAVMEIPLVPGDEIQIGKFHMLFFGGKQ